MELTDNEIGTILVPIIVACIGAVAIIYRKSRKNKPVVCIENLSKHHVITTMQKQIDDIKESLTHYHLDTDQLNTRLSRIEGNIEVILSKLT